MIAIGLWPSLRLVPPLGSHIHDTLYYFGLRYRTHKSTRLPLEQTLVVRCRLAGLLYPLVYPMDSITIRLESVLKRLLEQQASAAGHSLSSWLRVILENHLENSNSQPISAASWLRQILETHDGSLAAIRGVPVKAILSAAAAAGFDAKAVYKAASQLNVVKRRSSACWLWSLP